MSKIFTVKRFNLLIFLTCDIFSRMISLGVMLGLYHSFDYQPVTAAEFLDYECQSTFDYFTSGYIVLLFATNLLEFLVSWLSSKGKVHDMPHFV